MREALAAYRDAHELNGAALAQANLGFALMGQGRIAAGVHEVEAGIRFVHEAGSCPWKNSCWTSCRACMNKRACTAVAMATTRKQQALAKELFHTERDQPWRPCRSALTALSASARSTAWRRPTG